MRQRYTYCLVRYAPDRGAGERINVAVVLYDAQRRYLDTLVDNRGSYLSCVFEGFTGKAYRLWASDFKGAVRHVGLRWANGLPLEKDEPPTLAELLRSAQPSWGAAIEFSEERMVVGYDAPSTVLHDLFDRYVAMRRPRDSRPKPNITDTKIWETFARTFRSRNLLPLVGKIAVDVKDMAPLEFEHSIKVEKWRALQPVSFDLSDDDAIRGKVARWAGLASRMVDRPDLDGIFYLVAQPSNPDLYSDYDAAVKWLSETPYARDVVEVQAAQSFTERLEKELAALGV